MLVPVNPVVLEIFTEYKYTMQGHSTVIRYRVRNLKFATYLKFATCGNTNKINEQRYTNHHFFIELSKVLGWQILDFWRILDSLRYLP